MYGEALSKSFSMSMKRMTESRFSMLLSMLLYGFVKVIVHCLISSYKGVNGGQTGQLNIVKFGSGELTFGSGELTRERENFKCVQ